MKLNFKLNEDGKSSILPLVIVILVGIVFIAIGVIWINGSVKVLPRFWRGLLFVIIGLAIFAILIYLFPGKRRKEAEREKVEPEQKEIAEREIQESRVEQAEDIHQEKEEEPQE